MRLAICIAVIAVQTFGLLATVAAVGKPRKPLTGGVAVAVVVVSAAFMAGVVYLYVSAS